MLLIYLIFPFQKLKRVYCKVEGCKGLVVNIKRLCHPDTVLEEEDEVIKTGRKYERKECDICGVRTTRLDLHLIRVHGWQRGEELLAVLKDSPAIKIYTKETAALDRCLNDFK